LLPTVTDANLVLGRIQADAFLGGAMTLDSRAATAALQSVAGAMGVSIEAAAHGIVEVTNEHMAQALRIISVQRGVDPCNHVLVSFGGAGGLHVCALAEALGMSRAMVPVHAGVLSALGMLTAPCARQLSRTVNSLLDHLEEADLEQQLQRLAGHGRDELRVEGVDTHDIDARFSLDLRYRGQSSTLNLAWQGKAVTGEAFHAAHEQRYGHRLEIPVELVNLRCGLHGKPPEISLPPVAGTGQGPSRTVRVAGCAGPVPLWQRAAMGDGLEIKGPALIAEPVATTWLPDGWSCRVDGVGNLLLAR
jgi:N-methylhydantoinase A